MRSGGVRGRGRPRAVSVTRARARERARLGARARGQRRVRPALIAVGGRAMRRWRGKRGRERGMVGEKEKVASTNRIGSWESGIRDREKIFGS